MPEDAADAESADDAGADVADRPNVLFVFSDQHRGMDVGYAGNEDVHTPNMDRLADEGRAFTNAVATVPLCGPNRATLLTGQYPLTHGAIANDVPLDLDAPSVAEVFGVAGYRTGYVGKWHLDGVPRDKFTPPGPSRQGFDDFWAAFNCSHDYMDAQYYRDGPEPIDVDGYEPVEQTDLAMEFMGQDDERPFCLFLSYGPPHAPYDAVPEEYREMYDPGDLSLRENVEPIQPQSAGYPGAADMDPRETLADYYAQISAVDDQLGRLLDFLDEEGLAEDTVVVYTSDHGDMLFSHGMLKKEQPHEESVTVPLVARWPGEIPAGTVDETPFGTVDVAPTLLSLTGATSISESPTLPPGIGESVAGVDLSAVIEEQMEGTDLAGALRGEDLGDDAPDAAFICNVAPADQASLQGLPAWRGVRTERYTYAEMHDGTAVRPWVLFDNEEDPYQLRNRMYHDDYRDVRERLAADLEAWLDRLDDDFLTRDEHIRQLGIVEDWNTRENYMHPEDPELLEKS